MGGFAANYYLFYTRPLHADILDLPGVTSAPMTGGAKAGTA